MGNHTSMLRFWRSGKTEDEELDHIPYQILPPATQIHHHPPTTLTRKLFSIPIFIYNITKSLLQKLWKTEKSDPLLPTLNPVPKITHYYPQTGRVTKSIPGSAHSRASEAEKGRNIKVVVPTITRYSPQIPPPQADRVVNSIPGSTCSLASEDIKKKVVVPKVNHHSALTGHPAILLETGRVIKSIPGLTCPLATEVKNGLNSSKKDCFIKKEGMVQKVNHQSARIGPPAILQDHKIQLETGRVIKSIPGAGVNSSKEEKGKKTERVVVLEKVVWIKHYSNRHRILLVGEGDFSFSVCLAVVFGSASNMIATSIDCKGYLRRNYEKAPSNMNELEKRGCKVMNEIDATIMANHELLGHLKFDRIVYNFPYAGFVKKLTRRDQLRLHKKLVEEFLKNAKEMINENGEIHISHKENSFHNEWGLESMASCHQLKLIEAVRFNRDDYPGYYPKYGFGGNKNFDCDPSKTYKFGHKWVQY